MGKKGESKWTAESIEQEALKYLTRTEFLTNAYRAYLKARDLGILDKVCVHMPKRSCKWTKEAIRKEAAKYLTKADFRKNARTAYDKASNLGILNEVTEGMLDGTKDNIKWTKKAIYNAAKTCTTVTEFNHKFKWAAERARSMNIHKKVTAHLKQGKAKLFGHLNNNMIGLYFLYKDEEIIYIGKSTSCIRSRLVSHRIDKDFDKLVIYSIPNKSDIHLLELYYIDLHKPKLNTGEKEVSVSSLTFDNINTAIKEIREIEIKDTYEKTI